MRVPAPPAFRITLLGLFALALLVAAPARVFAYGYEPRTTIINTAVAQIGKPYKWAGAGPDSFDCSGLTMYCYASAGISLPHQSGMIWSLCDTVTAGQLEPGDLVFRASRLTSGAVQPTKASEISHVGMYVGGGRVLEASSYSKPIGYNSLGSFKFFGRLKEKYWPDQDRTYDQPELTRGDFNGDGRGEVAFVYKTGSTSIRIVVVPSNGTTMGPAKNWYVSNGAWDWNRTKAVAGDFNGDRKTDVACLYRNSDGSITMWVFKSTGSAFVREKWWASAPTGWTWSRMKLTAGDFDGNGKADVAALYDHGGGSARLWVFRSSGTAFTAGSWWYTPSGTWWAKWTRIAAGDITGDGKADLAMLYNVGRDVGKTYVFSSTGSAFSNRGAWYAPPSPLNWNDAKMTVGDFDGNKRADVMILQDLHNASSRLVRVPSLGSYFTAVNTWWTSPVGKWDWERTRLAPGEFNRDGRSDLYQLYDMQSSASRVWQFPSTAGPAAGTPKAGWDSGTGGLDWNRVR
jgi:hypothetical protein